MVFEFVLIVRQAITTVIPGDAGCAVEEILEIAEGCIEEFGVAFGAPVGGWAAGGGELCADHVRAGLCVRFEELHTLLVYDGRVGLEVGREGYVDGVFFGFDAARIVDTGADNFVFEAGTIVVDVVEF